MCGIAGIADWRPHSENIHRDTAKEMAAALTHRGPDGYGLFVGQPCYLAHRRLAVIDLSEAATQPMASICGRYETVFNGEIYNYRALRSHLESRGVHLRTQSDTEVLLELFARDGLRALDRIAGMFAFAVWDKAEQKLTLVRDRLGKKPLYYTHARGRLAFASELPALRPALRLFALREAVDPLAVDHYLALQYIPSPYSIFKNVRKLPPASYLVVGESAPDEPVRYWDPHARANPVGAPPSRRVFAGGFDDAADLVRQNLRDAVRARLVSDVPLGALLSGGIDSTAVVALMAQELGQPVKTFTIGLEPEAWSEIPHARLAAQALGTEHHDQVVAPGAIEFLENTVAVYGEPFGDPSALPTLLVSRLARQHVTVVLTGDGGDENFAGYERYDWLYGVGKMLPILRGLEYRGLLRRMLTGQPLDFSGGLGALLAGLAGANGPGRAAAAQEIGRRGLVLAREAGFDLAAIHVLYMTLCRRPFREALWGGQLPDAERGPEATLLRRARELHALYPDEPIRAMAALDSDHYLRDCLMTKLDRAAMHVSLEARSPFLDHRLVELAASLPQAFSYRPGMKKRVLKRALEGIVPEALLHRRKQGFGLPLNEWLSGELAHLPRELLFAPGSRVAAHFDLRPLAHLLERPGDSLHKPAHALWNLMVLELWLRQNTKTAVRAAA